MSRPAVQRTSVSALVGRPVTDAGGAVRGHVQEFAVDPVHDTDHIAAFLLRGEPRMMVEMKALASLTGVELRLLEGAEPTALTDDANFLLLERDLLDQQIIDVHGHKVVRVNDVGLVWEPVN